MSNSDNLKEIFRQFRLEHDSRIAESINGSAYSLPSASTSTKGGVKVGNGLAMDGDTLNCTVSNETYTLPSASTSTKGGVKVGNGLAMDGDVLNVTMSAGESYANASSLQAGLMSSDDKIKLDCITFTDGTRTISGGTSTTYVVPQYYVALDGSGPLILYWTDDDGDHSFGGYKYGEGAILASLQAHGYYTEYPTYRERTLGSEPDFLEALIDSGILPLTAKTVTITNNITWNTTRIGNVLFSHEYNREMPLEQLVIGVDVDKDGTTDSTFQIPVDLTARLIALESASGTGGASYALPTASTSTKGGIVVGNGLAMDGDTLNCTVSNETYTLPTASTSTKGGIVVGNGLAMDGDTLNCTVSNETYTLPTASTSTKGGVKVGNGLAMDGDTLNVTPVNAFSEAVSLNGGFVAKSVESDLRYATLKANYAHASLNAASIDASNATVFSSADNFGVTFANRISLKGGYNADSVSAFSDYVTLHSQHSSLNAIYGDFNISESKINAKFDSLDARQAEISLASATINAYDGYDANHPTVFKLNSASVSADHTSVSGGIVFLDTPSFVSGFNNISDICFVDGNKLKITSGGKTYFFTPDP